MNGKELNVNNQATDQEPTPRPWVTPTFERVKLEEALGAANKGTFFVDNITYNS